ncbi:hypothetical protein D3C72_1652940 [compost metagenome]
MKAGERRLPVLQHAAQAAGGQVVGDQRSKALRHAEPSQHRRIGQFGIVEHQPPRDGYVQVTPLTAEFPGHEPAIGAAMDDAVVALQLLRAQRHPVAREVARRGHHHLALGWPDRHRDHALRQRFTQADAGVEPLGDQIGQRRLHAQFHLYLRIPGQEGRQRRQNPAFGNDAWQGDAQPTGRHRPRAVQVVEGRFDLCQPATHALQEACAVLGQTHPARGPLQQAHAHPRLQRTHAL